MYLCLKKTARPRLFGPLTHAVGKFLDKSEYSHGEVLFSDGMSASSVMFEGVRFKRIVYHPDAWDFWTIPDELEKPSRQWFIDHEGEDYDDYYMLRFGVPLFSEVLGKWGCMEGIGSSWGWSQSWRYGPGGTLARCKDMYNSKLVPYAEVFGNAQTNQ